MLLYLSSSTSFVPLSISIRIFLTYTSGVIINIVTISRIYVFLASADCECVIVIVAIFYLFSQALPTSRNPVSLSSSVTSGYRLVHYYVDEVVSKLAVVLS